MAEYKNVEKPFLNKLNDLGWEIIVHGFGIPQDPSISLRSSFKELTLKSVFKEAVKSLNKVDGAEWLNDKQLDDLHREITATESNGLSLLEANKEVQ
jgi:type I restriction enzyme R subunit